MNKAAGTQCTTHTIQKKHIASTFAKISMDFIAHKKASCQKRTQPWRTHFFCNVHRHLNRPGTYLMIKHRHKTTLKPKSLPNIANTGSLNYEIHSYHHFFSSGLEQTNFMPILKSQFFQLNGLLAHLLCQRKLEL